MVTLIVVVTDETEISSEQRGCSQKPFEKESKKRLPSLDSFFVEMKFKK